MVTETVNYSGKKAYRCEKCNIAHITRTQAEKCEAKVVVKTKYPKGAEERYTDEWDIGDLAIVSIYNDDDSLTRILRITKIVESHHRLYGDFDLDEYDEVENVHLLDEDDIRMINGKKVNNRLTPYGGL